MTGLQALERSAPADPITYGRPDGVRSIVPRRGTLTLIGNLM